MATNPANPKWTKYVVESQGWSQMKIGKKFLLLLLVVIAYTLYIWVSYSLAAEKFRWQVYAPETESDLASAFAYALSINQPVAYSWIDPKLKPRLDTWMDTHQSKTCTDEYDWFFDRLDENGNYDISFGCYSENGHLSMDIDNIVIEDMKVIDWGEVREGD